MVLDSDRISESIIFTFRIWFEYGVYEKVSNWIRIAKFPYPYTTGVIQDVTNDGGNVFFAMVFIFTKNQNYFVSMCCTHHNQ